MKKILITHQKGGVGKSTLCYNLAQNIAANSKVAVFDLDPQGSLAQLQEMISSFDIIPMNRSIEEILELDYDFILIDTPPYLSNHLPELIRISDLIIVPTKAGILDLLAIGGTLKLIEDEGKVKNSLIVLNMVKANTTLTLDIMLELEKYKAPVASSHISDLVAFTRSIFIGGVQKDKNAQNQLNRLTKEVLNILIEI